ncbi:polyprenyl synthetase [Fusarium circinatum]|uniref:Polyprenyl synthetase n=1 Tax=Fusarium circinatum TaxID=48490 RepID=A0A8H5X708_FUSCI|nr:polyprenyl synthetase [Fusarium circinatum]
MSLPMDFIYRYSFEPTDCDTDGLCDGVPIRKHKGLDLDEVAIYKAQYDWEEHVGPKLPFRGGMGSVHNFICLTLPECLPERLEIVSYANEFAFLHDDITDVESAETVAAENDEFLDALQQGIRNGDIESRNSGKRHLQAYIFKQMASIDRPRALAAMNAWATFVNTGAGCAHDTNFKTLDEYLHYRSTDVGYMFWHALIIFGCAITIPDHEINLCHQLALPAIMSVTLTNDIWSYGKEAAAAEKAGKPGDFVNALVVLQRQRNCSLQEAERLCRARNKIEVAKCLRDTKETRERSDVSQDLKDYLYHMLFGVSGNAIWSTQCRRYDMSAPYNERQQARLQQTKEELSSSYDPAQAAKEATMTEATEIHRLSTPDSPGFEELSVRAILEKTGQNDDEKPSEWTGGSETSEPTTSDHSLVNGHDDSSTACSAEEADPKSDTSSSGHETKWTVPQSTDTTHKKTWSDACAQNLPPMEDDIVMEPYRYLCSLPSKGVRNKTIDALNFWLKVPADQVNTIKAITESLHGSSLMLDDIEDHSQLRRGKPSAHAVFGEAQTINSATFQYIQCVSQLNRLKSPKALGIFVDEIRQLFIGQAYELQWTSTMICPSLDEYLQMVDGKTGGLFRLLMRLMAAESPVDDKVDFSRLCQLFGRYFQIRDDYANLKLADYTQQKGFCEDLDEGKFSLTLVIIFNEPTRSPKATAQLRNLLVQRSINKGMTFEQKILALDLIEEAGGFMETEKVLHSLYNEMELELQRLSGVFGVENHQLELILEMLRVE